MREAAVAHIEGEADGGPSARRGWRRVLLGAAALVLVFAGTLPPTRVAGSGDSLVQAGGTGLQALAGDLPTTGQGTGAVADPLVATTPSTPDAASTSSPPTGTDLGTADRGQAAPSTVPTTTPAPPVATTVFHASAGTAIKPRVTPASPPPVVTCRNSTDPACGPFRFDPQPAVDVAMTVQAVVEPASPVAGQELVFRLTLVDPDGGTPGSSIFDFGDSAIGESSFAMCDKYGPWDPPAGDAPTATEVQEVRHTYASAGTYTATFSFEAGPFECVDAVTGRGDTPYASPGSATVVVVVT